MKALIYNYPEKKLWGGKSKPAITHNKHCCFRNIKRE